MKIVALITFIVSFILLSNAQIAGSLGGLTVPTGVPSTANGASQTLPIDSSVNTPVPPIATSATPSSILMSSFSMSPSMITSVPPSSSSSSSSSSMNSTSAAPSSSAAGASSSATNAAAAFSFGSKEMVVAAWIAGLAIPMVL